MELWILLRHWYRLWTFLPECVHLHTYSFTYKFSYWLRCIVMDPCLRAAIVNHVSRWFTITGQYRQRHSLPPQNVHILNGGCTHELEDYLINSFEMSSKHFLTTLYIKRLKIENIRFMGPLNQDVVSSCKKKKGET